ncbi:hypothetical protein BKA69DRAFT_1070870 [Paraphysoderma sedebokerense]|nr:hypothetical protein BKA69DRAFT_1070870 [Paraphysoderma sedebokerense]
MAIFKKNQVKDSDESYAMKDVETASNSGTNGPLPTIQAVKSIHNHILQTLGVRRIVVFISALLVFFGVSFLLIHFLIVPAVVRSRFSSGPLYIYPDHINATLNSNNSILFNFKGEVYMDRLPTKIKVAPGPYTVVSRLTGKPVISEIHIPKLKLKPDDRDGIEFSSYLNLGDLDTLASILKEMSREGGLSNELAEFEVIASELSVKVWGIWLPVTRATRTISIAGLTTQKLLDAILYSQPLYVPEQQDSSLDEDPRPQRKYTPPKLDNLTSTNVQMQGANYKEFTLNAEFSGINSSPFTGLFDAAFNLNTKDNRQFQVRVQNLLLPEPFQQGSARPSFNVKLPENFNGLPTNINDVVKEITEAKSVLIPQSIKGPIEWFTNNTQVEWVSKVTEGIVIPLKVSQ